MGASASILRPDMWDDWVEWDGKESPKRVARRYTLVPTVCFNCESACGLLAYVDKDTYEIRKFEGNPVHPGSRGRNCAKGPATHNQVYDPERILYPLKRVGKRGEGKWERISWDQALTEIAGKMRESKLRRPNGIVYHVGRPGEDGYTNRVVQTWGMDGHNSHTNICSSSRAGYNFWTGQDRPSPDYANARTILLISRSSRNWALLQSACAAHHRGQDRRRKAHHLRSAPLEHRFDERCLVANLARQ